MDRLGRSWLVADNLDAAAGIDTFVDERGSSGAHVAILVDAWRVDVLPLAAACRVDLEYAVVLELLHSLVGYDLKAAEWVCMCVSWIQNSSGD